MNELPTELAAATTPIIKVDWLTYSHQREAGKDGLGNFLVKAWGLTAKEEPYLLETSNDTYHYADVSEISDFDRTWVPKDREELLSKLANGGVEDYKLRSLLVLAVMDGKLPPGKYLIGYSY